MNDYIFGPTFDDLSKILGVSFEMISYFPIIRQVSYTFGALGKIEAFDYYYWNEKALQKTFSNFLSLNS